VEEAMPEKASREVLTAKQFVTRVSSVPALRERATTFFFRIYALLIITTLGIFLLQGFHLWGFSLELSLLHLLGGAVIGEIAGLAAMVYGFLFRKQSRNRNRGTGG
jgi:hypothetical protein